MGWLSTLREAHALNVHKGEAERAAKQMYGNGKAAEDATGGAALIDRLNGEPAGTTLSDMMERRGMVDGSMRDMLRSPEQYEERLDRMDAAEEARLDREVSPEDAHQAAIDAVPQAVVDHELAMMNEEQDQRFAAQNRKAMDIPEPTTPVWERAQAMASEAEAEAPAPNIDPA